MRLHLRPLPTINQAAITGESMPVEASQGSKVFAATIAQMGSLRVKTTLVGPDTTFGRVVRMVEEAEANRAEVQRIGDKFAAYYLPVVAGIALVTYLVSRNPLELMRLLPGVVTEANLSNLQTVGKFMI